MINPSKDIDYFIERQRSKLNKSNPRQGPNRRGPPPARPQPVETRLDYQVARILEEPSPRLPSSQSYIPPSPRPNFSSVPTPTPGPPIDDEQTDNRSTFFDSFGNYAEKRALLKQDLKREYNEFLRNQDGTRTNRKNLKTSTSRTTNNRRVQFKADPTVIAPWEKDGSRTVRNSQVVDETFSSSISDYGVIDRSLFTVARDDEAYIRAREEYILELYEQIRELQERRRLLELEGKRLSSDVSSAVRSHYAEDLRALNTLLAERLQQRNTVDLELARILNRPPVIGGTNRLASIGFVPGTQTFDAPYDGGSPLNFPPANGSPPQTFRQERRARRPAEGVLPLGQEPDKENEQAAKKRYQQELQSQIREAQMRKVQDKQKQYEYDKKLEQETKRYDYFGRSGGGAPMRDRDGNIIANLADVRNPPETVQPRSQTYTVLEDRYFSNDLGFSSSLSPSGQDQLLTNRSGSPNHTRGAVSNGIFGTVKTEEQLMREEKYKQDLKRQIEEKRQRELDDLARRRAEEEREIAKHTEWLKQMEKQSAEETARKQEKEAQERLYQQQLEDERERQRLIEEEKERRRSKREEQSRTAKSEEQNIEPAVNDDEPPPEGAYRSSSPPVPTIKNRGKKKKGTTKETPAEPIDESPRQSPLIERGESVGIIPDHDVVSQSSSRRGSNPNKQKEIIPGRKKVPPSSYRPPRPVRTYSMTSLRSDGSDSDVLNRLEQLKRQLKDKEIRLQQQVHRQRAEGAVLSDIEEQNKFDFGPTGTVSRRSSPEYVLKPARLPRGLSSPSNSDRLLRVLQKDDDEFKPSYFRDDSILMRGTDGYISPSRRVDLVDGIFVTNVDDPVRRRRLDLRTLDFLERDNPTSMANLELNRIAEKNELRLKKLRALESDDTSMLDNNEVLERFQQRQRLRTRGSLTTLHDDAWLR